MNTNRRFLVVVRAGEASLHRKWLEGQDRNWDLVVSWYGDTPYRPIADEIVIPIKGGKGDGLVATFAALPELIGRYEYFWLPDDDIDTDCATICTLFDIASRESLKICQPALTHDSYHSYLHTLVSPSFQLRYTSFVEVMVPCIARDHLIRVLPYFERNPSCFGVDRIWTRLDPDNHYRAAIIDVAVVRHTRPVGTFLLERIVARGLDPGAREKEILAAFGLANPDPGFPCYAGRRRGNGRPYGAWTTRFLMAMDYLARSRSWVDERAWRRARRIFRQRRGPLAQLVAIPRPAHDPERQPSLFVAEHAPIKR